MAMPRLVWIWISLGCFFMTSAATAATQTYVFDRVTAVEIKGVGGLSKLAGIEKDISVHLDILFQDAREIVARCVSVFLTAMEKPGEYYFHVRLDPDIGRGVLKACRLERKL
jgi:hypothetical protein